MLIGVQSRTTPGPTLRLRCPVFGSEEGLASSYQYGERVMLLHTIPVSPYTEVNYVKCGHCSESFVSDVNVFELPLYPADVLPGLLRRPVPLVAVTLVVCGILLLLFPIIGLLLNGVALLVTWRRRHWTRTVSMVGTALAAVVNVFFFTGLVLWG